MDAPKRPTPSSLTPPAGTVSPRLPEQVWMVIWPNGQHHFVHKELIGGMEAWAKGVDVTVVEYRFDKVIQTAAPKKPTK
jgi:hypothetical protein